MQMNPIARRRFNFLLLLLLTITLSLAFISVNAQTPQSLSVIAFPGTGNWPIRLAQDKGYFAQTGLEVTLTPTPSSVFQNPSNREEAITTIGKYFPQLPA